MILVLAGHLLLLLVTDAGETMGYGLSKLGLRKSAEVSESTIKVSNLRASIDPTPTLVDEESDVVLKYRTPHFRASATVKFPCVHRQEVWTIGWIQACTTMTFTNQYGKLGCSSWEIPQLNNTNGNASCHPQLRHGSTKLGASGIVSDSDGRLYPWYGATTEVFQVRGTRNKSTTRHISMNDNFYPCVTWDVPLSTQHTPRLTRIHRDQSFNTWLVALNENTGRLLVLRTVQWRMQLDISVDCSKPRGQRARLVSDPIQPQPVILEKNVPVPPEALLPPSANNAQMLLWIPAEGPARVAIAPKHPPAPPVHVVGTRSQYYQHQVYLDGVKSSADTSWDEEWVEDAGIEEDLAETRTLSELRLDDAPPPSTCTTSSRPNNTAPSPPSPTTHHHSPTPKVLHQLLNRHNLAGYCYNESLCVGVACS